MNKTFVSVIDEEKSVEILEDILRKSGLDFRRTKPGEEGGFFITDKNGNRRKLTNQEVFDNIFSGIAKPN